MDNLSNCQLKFLNYIKNNDVFILKISVIQMIVIVKRYIKTYLLYIFKYLFFFHYTNFPFLRIIKSIFSNIITLMFSARY